jgi:hypothetical protein
MKLPGAAILVSRGMEVLQAAPTLILIIMRQRFTMDWDCPKCGLINPPSARFCDCGYDTVAQQVDRHRAPKHDPSTSPGLYASYQLVRFGIGGVVCGFGGIGLLLWELSEGTPSFWAILRSLLISAFGFGLVGALIWVSTRSR